MSVFKKVFIPLPLQTIINKKNTKLKIAEETVKYFCKY